MKKKNMSIFVLLMLALTNVGSLWPHPINKDRVLRQLDVRNIEELMNIKDDQEFWRRISSLDELPIVIVTPSYKNAEWYRWNLDSIFSQNYTNWRLIYLDDNSPDGTGELVKEYVKERGFEDKVTVIPNKNRRKALANLYTGIQMCGPTEIVAILDGDDRFLFENVLKMVNFIYSAHDVWLTYGQYREYPSGKIGFCQPYTERVIQNNQFRDVQAGPSHLRTFYAGLFHKINIEDLLYEGDFFPMTYDLAIMFPMLEMAGNRFKFCPLPLVDYNTTNPINDHKVSQELQRRCDKVIRARKRYTKLDHLFD